MAYFKYMFIYFEYNFQYLNISSFILNISTLISNISSLILRGSTTQNRLIFQLCFIMLKIKLYVCRILCENFIQIGQ